MFPLGRYADVPFSTGHRRRRSSASSLALRFRGRVRWNPAVRRWVFSATIGLSARTAPDGIAQYPRDAQHLDVLTVAFIAGMAVAFDTRRETAVFFRARALVEAIGVLVVFGLPAPGYPASCRLLSMIVRAEVGSCSGDRYWSRSC